MPPAYRATALLAALAWIGCTGGQSGTETPTGRPTPGDAGPFQTTSAGEGGNGDVQLAAGNSVCACALAGRGALLRGRLLALDACEVRAQVEEVLALPEGQSLRAKPGDTIRARHAASGCSEGLALEPGDAVLLVYAEAEPDMPGEALIARWGQPLLFGSTLGEPLALPREQQLNLLDAEDCSHAFDAKAGDSSMRQKLPASACAP